MWIKLISPRVTLRPMDSAFKRQMAPPLSLLVVAALTPERHQVTLTDENVEPLVLDDTPDLVGITVKADTAYRAWAIARLYRQRGIRVVLGGIHPTVCPEENLFFADAILIGEAEGLWPRVVADAQLSRLQRVYRNERAPDLSTTPVPRWDLVRDKNYLYINTLTVGRGCPWRCDFCYNSSPNLPASYRMKPIPNILEEIASLGTRHVMFIDDNFIADPRGARELLRALKPLRLTWHTAVSADIGRHEDILELMAESGCRSLFIGFESMNPASLASCHKIQNEVGSFGDTVSKIHALGLMVNASLVFGFDHDGPEVFDSTLQWLLEHRIETVTAHILTPYPGTRLHRRLLEAGRIIDHNLTHYNTSRVVFRPTGMSVAQLQAGYLELYRRFYSWKGIRQRYPGGAGQRKAFLAFNLLYRKLGRLTSVLGRVGLMRALGRLGATLSYPRLARQGAPSIPSERTGTAGLHTHEPLVHVRSKFSQPAG